MYKLDAFFRVLPERGVRFGTRLFRIAAKGLFQKINVAVCQEIGKSSLGLFVVVCIDINGQYLAGKFVKLQVNSMIAVGTAVVSGKSLSLNGIPHHLVNIASAIAEFDSF